jgi:hypothetical protein
MNGMHLQNDYSADAPRVFYVASPSAGADAWEAGAQAATTKWATNLQNTNKDIVGRAIAQQSVMQANFAASITSGRWQNALSAVGNAGIKAAAAAKQGNYGTGVSASKAKYAAAAAKLYPYIAQGQAMIEAMPSGSIGASKARASAWIDYMAAGKGQFKG